MDIAATSQGSACNVLNYAMSLQNLYGAPVPDNTTFNAIVERFSSRRTLGTLHAVCNLCGYTRRGAYNQQHPITSWYNTFKNKDDAQENCMWSSCTSKYRAPRRCLHGDTKRTRTLSTNHRERGLHYRTTQGPDAPIKLSSIKSKQLFFNDHPTYVDWSGHVGKETTIPVKDIKHKKRTQTHVLNDTWSKPVWEAYTMYRKNDSHKNDDHHRVSFCLLAPTDAHTVQVFMPGHSWLKCTTSGGTVLAHDVLPQCRVLPVHLAADHLPPTRTGKSPATTVLKWNSIQ